jgi:hypothetical protein
LAATAASGARPDTRRVAAQLSGAAEALCEQLGAPVSPVDRLWYDPAITHARAAIGEEAFVAARAVGQVLTLDQAIDYALQAGATEYPVGRREADIGSSTPPQL